MTRPATGAPDRDRFTDAEWRVVSRLRTPAAVQRYLNALSYNSEPAGATRGRIRGGVAA